ncbi:hypothetical protein BPOR_0383g00070 [Botrytis porri]|uniref:Uncharacterized protein n=1 Tax=Botrytis porri TaxID=87229 RepID=A0A4Z1KHK5_9HELO|nr:hypothetical protein BPOR_0383g00070 [Botrytis porri]
MDAGVADVVEITDCVAEALVVAVLEADEDIWVERIGVADAVEVDEEAPLMTKNPVLDISWELELYFELRSLNRRTYFASLLRLLVEVATVVNVLTCEQLAELCYLIIPGRNPQIGQSLKLITLWDWIPSNLKRYALGIGFREVCSVTIRHNPHGGRDVCLGIDWKSVENKDAENKSEDGASHCTSFAEKK